MTAPLFVHARIPVAIEPAVVASRIRDGGDEFIESATAAALAATADLRASAQFRAEADPTVAVRRPTDDEVGLVVARWGGDDGATGWPVVELLVTVVALPDGNAEIVLLSPSHPGFDLTTNRIDKVWRDRLGRVSVRSFGMALAAQAVRASPPSAATSATASSDRHDGAAALAQDQPSDPARVSVLV